MTRPARAYHETLASPGYSQANASPEESSRGAINCFSALGERESRPEVLGDHVPGGRGP